jgi:hypothetical protein
LKARKEHLKSKISDFKFRKRDGRVGRMPALRKKEVVMSAKDCGVKCFATKAQAEAYATGRTKSRDSQEG